MDCIHSKQFSPLMEVGIIKNDDIPKSINVVHLHGFWEDSDTLHTPKQLTTKRPQLKSSLSLNTERYYSYSYSLWWLG